MQNKQLGHAKNAARVKGHEKKSAIGEPMVELSKVWKKYRGEGVEVDALKEVSLSIRKGEFVAITGPSGSGKSTLMHIVGCLDKPTSGSVKLEGAEVSELSDDRLARLRGKKVGFVFQSFNLQPDLNVWDNVALPMRIHEMPEEHVRAKVDALLQSVGLQDRAAHYSNQLSGGQQQRVAIARALSTSPSLVLADEPTGNLDSASGRNIMEMLTKINEEEGVTVVLVTHEPSIMVYAQRIIRLLDGKVDSRLLSGHKNGGAPVPAGNS